MRSLGGAVAAVLAGLMIGCGAGQTDVNVPTVPPPGTSTEPEAVHLPKSDDPWTAFSATIIAGGQAMIASARGEAHDPRFDCDADMEDLRATDPHDREDFASHGGTSEALFFIIQELVLAWPTIPDEESRSHAPRGEWKSVEASLALFPDGRIRWLNVATATAGVDPSLLAPIDALEPTVRAALEDLTRKLPTAACALPPPTLADIGAIPLSPSERKGFLRDASHFAAAEQAACTLMRGATGPWRTKADHLVVGILGANGVLALKSRIAAPGGRVCLGKAQVVVH